MRPSDQIRQLVTNAAEVLRESGVDTPLVDARLLAAHLLDVPPLTVFHTDVPAGFPEAYREVIARRAQREPLQHITGTAPFGPLELAVGPGVFIPRPETEVLADWAVRCLDGIESPVVIDLGTGSGALAIYIATVRPDAAVTAVDMSETALRCAKANAERIDAHIQVIAGDMTAPGLLRELDGSVNLVVANPPYVPETPDLSPEVYFDPHEAVFSGKDGMNAIRGLVPVAARLLAPGGRLGIEHDDTQAGSVKDAVLSNGCFTMVNAVRDLTGRKRFVTAGKLNR